MSTTMPTTNTLNIHQYELLVYLGVTPAEREHLQLIWIDFSLNFPQPLRAIHTDALDDTVCYHRLLTALTQHVDQRSFKLIEHLAGDLFQFIKTHLQQPIILTLTITKKPPIPGLSHVSFTLRDVP